MGSFQLAPIIVGESAEANVRLRHNSEDVKPPLATGSCNPEYLLKNGPLLKKVMPDPPKFGLYLVLNYRPFKPLLNYQHGRFWGLVFIRFPKTPSK